MKHRSTEPAQQRARAQSVRIIGGTHKRSILPVIDAPGLRPTSDRVRETLFNWLGQDLTGWRCIDAFAGTGALGLEAASRGAREVLMVESAAPAVRSLQDTVVRLKFPQVRVERGDALTVLAREGQRGWDGVFLDPPFAESKGDLFARCLSASAHAVAPRGWCYLEAPESWSDGALADLGWSSVKRGKAGAVHFHLLERLSSVL